MRIFSGISYPAENQKIYLMISPVKIPIYMILLFKLK